MIELPVDQMQPLDRVRVRPWIICESGTRWLRAAERFAPQLMPEPLVASITPANPADAMALTLTEKKSVIFWEVRPDSFTAACDHVAQVSVTSPGVLQIVGSPGLSSLQRIVLSELRASAALDHPEGLPRLAAMIHGYFARLA